MKEDLLTKNHELKSLIDWLLFSPIRTEKGAIISWLNPDHPGFIYDEATAIFIKLMTYLYEVTGSQTYLDEAIKSAEYLMPSVLANKGIGKDGKIFLFDTGICLSAFIELNRFCNKYHEAIWQMEQFILECINKRKAYVLFGQKKDCTNSRNSVWSLKFGPHLLKLAIPILELYREKQIAKYITILSDLVDDLLSASYHNGRFFIDPYSDEMYLHSHCYATEGLLYLVLSGLDQYQSYVEKSLSFMAEIQYPNGGIPCWYKQTSKSAAGDATVQALRMWTLYNKEKFRTNIECAESFMHSLKSTNGGIHYSSESRDLNSWVTMFYIQALCFQNSFSGIKSII